MRDLNEQQPATVKQGGTVAQVLFFWAFLSLFVVIGLGILIYGGHLLIKSSQSASWPSTEGIVKTADLERRSSDHGFTYNAEVTFDYFVNGTLFTGNNIRVVKVSSSSTSDARADLRKYAVGAKVKVFYSPVNFADSVLEPGIHPSSWFLPLVGCAFIVFSLIMALVAVISGRIKKKLLTTTNTSFTQ